MLTKFLREHYKLLKRIHKSAANEIFLVEDVLTREQFALKIISRNNLLYSEIAAIDHPNLPKIFLVEETNSATYVVEEFLRGQNLQDYLDVHGALSESAVIQIGVKLCDCLEALHSRHIIHRDIKPANLFLTTAGELKLIDFDAARREKPNSFADTNLIGTPGFAAPEQYGFHQTDERTDIYALGLTLRLLAGYENYRGALTAVFDKCTEFDPRKRYGSVKNLRRAIILRRHLRGVKKFFAASLAGAILLHVGIIVSNHVEPVTEKISPSTRAELFTEKISPSTRAELFTEKISPSTHSELFTEKISPSTHSELFTEKISPSTRAELLTEKISPSSRSELFTEKILPSSRAELFTEKISPSTQAELFTEKILPSSRAELFTEKISSSTRAELLTEKISPSSRSELFTEKISPSTQAESFTEKISPSNHVESVVDENSLEKIIAQTAQRVAEKNLEPPPRMPRRDFARTMPHLSDAEIDAKQEEYQRRLEMNQRIREFEAELPADLTADEKREATRIYTLREKKKLERSGD